MLHRIDERGDESLIMKKIECVKLKDSAGSGIRGTLSYSSTLIRFTQFRAKLQLHLFSGCINFAI